MALRISKTGPRSPSCMILRSSPKLRTSTAALPGAAGAGRSQAAESSARARARPSRSERTGGLLEQGQRFDDLGPPRGRDGAEELREALEARLVQTAGQA